MSDLTYALPYPIPRDWSPRAAQSIEDNLRRVFQLLSSLNESGALSGSGSETTGSILAGALALFADSTGKVLQASSGTGIVHVASGVYSASAVTYLDIQDVSATARILGRKTAGSGPIEECTLSNVLDFIGSPAQGDILYRGASSWAYLTPGTSGFFLQTQGASANPVWAATSGGDVTGQSVSVDGEIALFSGTTGKVVKRATGTGLVHVTSGVFSTGTAAYSDIQNVSATNRFLGRKSSGAGVIEELNQTDALAILGFAAPGDAIQTGTGHPQGVLSAAHGNLYRDTNNGYLYRKVGGGSTAYGWYPEPTVALSDGPVPFLALCSVATGSQIFNGASGHGALWGTAGVSLFTANGASSASKTIISGKQFAVAQTAGSATNVCDIETLNSGNAKLLDDDADIWGYIVTDGTAVTNTRIWFGWTTASMTDTVAAPGYTGTTNRILIQYLSDGNAVWEGACASSAGTTSRSLTASLGSVAANTRYKLRIRFVRQGTPTVYFSVNDGTEIAITGGNIPAAGATLFFTLGVEQVSGVVAKAIGWRAFGGSFGS
jgi:hypothetical protein